MKKCIVLLVLITLGFLVTSQAMEEEGCRNQSGDSKALFNAETFQASGKRIILQEVNKEILASL